MTGSPRKRLIASAFGRAAPSYDSHASLQRIVAAELAARIARLGLSPTAALLELGCGTGLLTRALGHILPGARGVITDLAPAMVRRCREALGPRHSYLVMDGEAPCLATRFDLVCASLAVQWFEDLPRALPALHALLAPGGWLAFATLAPGTLAGWHEAHLAEGLPPPTPPIPPLDPILALWPGERRTEQVAIRIPHADGRDFLRALRGIGATTPGPHHVPLGPRDLRRVLARFERDHQAEATWQVLYACLRA